MNVPLNIDWQQILLHLFNFVILFAILYFLLYSPVKKFMDNRRKQYFEMDEKTKNNLADSEISKNKYNDKIADVEKEIEEIKEKSLKQTQKICDARISDAKKQAEEIINQARNKAEAEKEKIIKDAEAEIASMVSDATEKLTLNESASEAFDQFLDAVERGGKNE